MLLIDNFSYTLFGWGIIDTYAFGRLFYSVFLISLFVFIVRSLNKAHLISVISKNIYFRYAAFFLLFAAGVFLVLDIYKSKDYSGEAAASSAGIATARQYPNIVFWASDGIEADHMSLYGYHRETTPNLDALESNMLIFDNAFSNAAQTTGAVTALLTGKHPARTKVFFPPQFLSQKDSYEHIPGVFKKLGYYNIQVAVSWWADSAELNFVDGFDIVNEVRVSNFRRSIPFEFYGAFQFLKALLERPEERVKHLLGLERMINPYREVAPAPRRWPLITDVNRYEMLEDAFQSVSEPFFLHMHLNDSHGVRCIDQDCEYDLNRRKYSASHQAITSENRVDYYDDAVADSDRAFQKLIEFLRARKVLDNTIIVVYSDHSAIHTLDRRIPLLIIFPKTSHRAGTRISTNAQLLDVGPTILDYLGIGVPDWMDGESLLTTEQNPSRRIFGVGVIPDEGGQAPGYGLLEYGLITCQRHYLLKIESQTIVSGDVNGHTDPCPEDELLSDQEAMRAINAHLGEFNIGNGNRRDLTVTDK